MNARLGVWTPWAQILCVECDYAGLKDSARASHHTRHLATLASMDRTAEIACPDGDALGTCEKCSAACWVRDDVAWLQQVGFRSSELDWEGPWGWSMQQTGGMCAALVFSSDAQQVVVTAMDGFFLVGTYASSDEGWESPIGDGWQSAPFFDDAKESIGEERMVQLVDECARKAIEFIRAGLPRGVGAS